MAEKEYTKGELTVLWDSSKCIHSGICARGLPEVFKPKDRPWVQMENAENSAIADQVRKCPSQALSLKND